MCGLIGYIGFNDKLLIDEKLLQKMNNLHFSRGPDFGNEIVLKKKCIGLAHRRLSIIDLDVRSHQPFYTLDEKHWIVFNGEIYNFFELKKELIGKGFTFRTTSDTEVLLYALIAYKENALEKIEGMFAFLYINLKDNYAIAARDKLGIKPLCYMKKKDYICFASTLTPLTMLPEFTGEIDSLSKFEMLTSKYVVAPKSIYKEIRKVLPGEYLKIDYKSGKVTQKSFWNPLSYINSNKVYDNEKELIKRIDFSLNEAVKRQMISDVPIGVFLSGGTDSSLLAAIMQKNSNYKIRTYSIGFREKKYDESGYAEGVAGYLKTDHSTFFVTPHEIIDNLKEITNVYDEPFGDASALPTYILSRYVRRDVKVALSGDGGDEQFFGYNRYSRIHLLYPLICLLPNFIRKTIYSLSNKIPRSVINHALSALFSYNKIEGLYPHYFAENFSTLTDLIGGGDRNLLFVSDFYKRNVLGYNYAKKNIFNGMMIGDILVYLHDDCLTKVDRASMAHSLEVRVPLLDEKVLELSFNIPLKYKLKNGMKKYILKKLLMNYIPSELVKRPKKGFGVPLDRWLFNEMNDFTMELLSKTNLIRADLDPAGVSKIIDHHKSGMYDHQYFLWSLCAYMNWFINKK